MADGLRAKAKVKQRTRSADEADKVRDLDRKLSRGNALTRPYAVATVTVPKTAASPSTADAWTPRSARAGFAPLRLDLSQDAAFAASTIPLGTCLTRKGDTDDHLPAPLRRHRPRASALRHRLRGLRRRSCAAKATSRSRRPRSSRRGPPQPPPSEPDPTADQDSAVRLDDDEQAPGWWR